MQPVISDTSCLIVLQKTGCLYLLPKLFKNVIITQKIADEWNQTLPDWILIQNASSSISQKILTATLDKGEASAIALALELQNSLLIIDEVKGRTLALQLGLTITGTLGILLLAKQNEIIGRIRPLLDAIQATDFRVSENLINAVLQLAGE